MAIASNASPSGWTNPFTDRRLCAAIVERLIFGGTIIETGCDSYRFAHNRYNSNTCDPGAPSGHAPGLR